MAVPRVDGGVVKLEVSVRLGLDFEVRIVYEGVLESSEVMLIMALLEESGLMRSVLEWGVELEV